jgi:hypothetical protein
MRKELCVYNLLIRDGEGDVERKTNFRTYKWNNWQIELRSKKPNAWHLTYI